MTHPIIHPVDVSYYICIVYLILRLTVNFISLFIHHAVALSETLQVAHFILLSYGNLNEKANNW